MITAPGLRGCSVDYPSLSLSRCGNCLLYPYVQRATRSLRLSLTELSLPSSGFSPWDVLSGITASVALCSHPLAPAALIWRNRRFLADFFCFI